MAAFEIGKFVVGQKPDCVRRPRGRCRRASGGPPVHGLIIPKMLRKQFLSKVLETSRIEPGDSIPNFNFPAHQSCTLLRFLRQSKCPRLKAAPNRHGKLDDMTCTALTRARLPKATRFRPAAHTSPLLAHGAEHQDAPVDPVGEHLAARASHGPYRAVTHNSLRTLKAKRVQKRKDMARAVGMI